MDFKDMIEEYIEEERKIISKMDRTQISEVMNVLESARLRKSNIYICGNGGSATTASHFVCDFNKGVSENLEIKYRFICLNDNLPLLLAAANDLGYENCFIEQIRGKVEEGDLFLAISGSGNSKNVITAAKYAKKYGAKVIGMTGYNGGELRKIADYQLHVPVDDMQITEDIHMMLDHLMMRVIKRKLETREDERAI